MRLKLIKTAWDSVLPSCCQPSDCPAAEIKRSRIKSGEAGQICGRIMAVLYRKGQQGSQISDNFAFLLLLSIKIGESRKYFSFPTDKDEDCFLSIAQMLKEIKITRGPNFSSAAEFFTPNWPERSAKSWQLCWACSLQLAVLAVAYIIFLRSVSTTFCIFCVKFII